MEHPRTPEDETEPKLVPLDEAYPEQERVTVPGEIAEAADTQVPLDPLMPEIERRLGPEKFDDGVPLF